MQDVESLRAALVALKAQGVEISMKAIAICLVVGGGVFVAGLIQMGVVKTGLSRPLVHAEKNQPAKASFPGDLVPAAQAKPVEKAAAFAPGPQIHKMLVVSPNGEVHRWQDDIPREWQAESVEETELVVVVGKERSMIIQTVPYNIGTPIDRIRFEVEVSVVEPKTGKILDNRLFQNHPRACRSPESYAITTIGRPVNWSTVFQWVSKHSHSGFPEEEVRYPVVTPDVD